MRKVALQFGLFAFILLVLFQLSKYSLLLGDFQSELLIALFAGLFLIFVFFVSRLIFKKKEIFVIEKIENGGQISFGKALGVGMLVALIPSVAFGIYTTIFIALQGEKWMQWALENMPPSQRSQFDANPELFTNPWFQGVVMFFTVLVIGFAYALISAFILKRQKAVA